MNIGQVARKSGLSAKMIRHYESIGVIPRAPKGASGYRRYEDADVMRLRFVRRARDAGLSMADIKRLLALWQERQRSSREVKQLVEKHLQDVDTRIHGLVSVKEALSHLVAHCHGDDRPDCPIIVAFSAEDEHADGLNPSRSSQHQFSRIDLK